MKNLWSDENSKHIKDDLGLRVYTSNLLGSNDELVLHGGGNTSVKSKVNAEDILFVKGSGWDLVSIKKEGFSPVKLDALLKMAKLDKLSDSDMVASQKNAMIDKMAPNPSVEAILHALIPFKYVDHTHADAIVSISNSKNGEKLIKDIFPNFLLLPYIMPGFLLAKDIYEKSRAFDWSKCEGIILHNHGIFTFDNDAKKSYNAMIKAVSKAEDFLSKSASLDFKFSQPKRDFDVKLLQKLISDEKGYDISIKINQTLLALSYAASDDLASFATRGVLTPEHIIRTKRVPLILENNDIKNAIEDFKSKYIRYFNKYAKDEICLNPAPNYAVIKNFGIVTFGKDEKEASVINDIIKHTMRAVLRADKLGGYQSISEKDSFDMEYWELEQAKLK
ncbi:MAG: oxidoreductase [Epsilonproteobacteria bacterium]|nr:oxidoreductase [Campylobacterota bacterium]